ncbi:Ig-like domain-containing protein [Corynebacterium sp. Marseille-P4321]|uniref:Ig-like domain-containing protein n=1 Tax=Corynebacterium sp. Marseille-P4321 TaxID=2736603 RepID=UPI0015889E41|nr:Ig-like domain-containing protein [Corynebacterium sp. Marseille-P4321]
MAKRFPFRTAIAGLTALAVTAPIISPVDLPGISAAVANAAAAAVSVDGPADLGINTQGTFTATVPGVSTGRVQFYLNGVPVGTPVDVDQSGQAAQNITPTTYGTAGAPHTVTARYIDGENYNPNPDGAATFTTPVMDKSIVVNDRDYDLYSGFGIGQTPTDIATSSLENPVLITPGSQYTLRGTMTVNDGPSQIYEVGFNPPSNEQYKAFSRIDEGFNVIGVGTGTGTQRNLNTGRRFEHPSWGTGKYPPVTRGYVGGQHPRTYAAGNGTKYILQGSFVAPTTPGVYVPQYASYKYGSNTHVLERMDEAAFRIAPQPIPDRIPRPDQAAADTTITLSGVNTATDKDEVTITADVTANGTPVADGTVRFFDGNTPLTDTLVAVKDGKAELKRTFQTGTYDIRAEFTPADPLQYNASATTANHALTVNASQFNTVTAYTGDVNGAKGTPVTLKATVDPVAALGSPATVEEGEVHFRVGNTVVAKAPVVNGVATTTHTFTLGGTQNVVAEYVPADGSNLNASQAQAVDVLITAETTVQLAASNANPTVNTPIDLNATFTPPLAAGKVEFWDITDTENPVKIGEATGANGSASTRYTPNDTQAHTIEARFVPTGNVNKPSTSEAITVTAKKYDVAVTVDPNQTFTTGQPGALTASVSPTNAEGTVEFSDGNRVLGTAEVKQGIATLDDVTFADAGTPEITAKFIPAENSNFAENTGSGTVTVTQAAQDTTVTLSGATDAPEAQDVTITATVTPQGAAGTVRFLEGGNELATITVADGKAELTRSWTPGTHTIRAEFIPAQPDAFNASATTTDHVLNVAPARVDTTTTYTGATEGEQNKPVTLKAQVAPVSGTEAAKGTVTFRVGNTVLAQGVAVDGQGIAETEHTFTQSGTQNAVAEFVPAEGTLFNPSSSTGTDVLIKATTTLSLQASNPAPTVGTPITLTARYTPALAAGKFEFWDVTDAANPQKLGEAAGSNGKAELRAYTPSTLGDKTIEARFVPSRAINLPATSDPITVSPQALATTVTVPEGQSFTAGTEGALTARITPNNAKGTVEFFNGADSLGTADVNNGVATKNVTFPNGGDKAITAKFTPAAGSNFAASEGDGTVTVAFPAADTTITLGGDTAKTEGETVTLNATVTPGDAAGQVRFLEGTNELGTVALADGQASLAVENMAPGTHEIRAEFIPADSAAFNASVTSGTHTVTVNQKKTATVIEYVGPTQSPAGQKINMLAEVKDADGNVITDGSVRFIVNGQPLKGDQPIGKTVAGKALYDQTRSKAEVYKLELQYIPAAGSNYAPSSSTAPVEIAIQAATTTTLTAQTTKPTVGTPVTLTAAVNPQLAKGTIELYDVTASNEGTKVGETKDVSGGNATFTVTPEDLSQRKYEARFTPAADQRTYAGSKSTVLTLTPQAIGSTITLAPNQAFTVGEAGALSATVAPAGATGRVQFLDMSTNVAVPKGEADVVDGVATLNGVTFSSAGDKSIKVKFTPTPGTNYAASESTGKVAVAKAAENTTLTFDAPTSTVTEGGESNVTVTVAPAGAAGQVRFLEVANGNTSELATVDVANGKATLKQTFAAGTHTIRAEFIPANPAEFTPSGTASDHVATVNVKSDVALGEGQVFTAGKQGPLSARVAPEGANGTVEFFDGDQSLGSAAVTDGVATVNPTFADAADNTTIRVVFTPAAGSNLAASENTGTVTVNAAKVAADTTVTVSGPATETTDNEATLTARVAPINAEGTVQFYDNGTEIGQAQNVVNGEATLTQKFAEGNHAITAKFFPAVTSEDAYFNESPVSDAHNLTISVAKIDTTVASIGNTTNQAGAKHYMKAEVKDADGNPVNGGQVKFTLDGTELTPQPVKDGIATFDKTFAAPGKHTLKLEYIPADGSKFNGSVSTEDATFEITAKATTTTLSASTATPDVNTPVTLTAAVSPLQNGTVTFWDVTDPDNAVQVGDAAAVTPLNGRASTQYTPTAIGARRFEARFAPEKPEYAASQSQPVTVAAQKISAQVTIPEGQALTAGEPGSVTVRVVPGGIDGTVALFDGATSLGTADVANGVATVDNVALNEAGDKAVRAVFTPSGETVYKESEGTGTINVVKPAEDTTVAVSGPATGKEGENVTLSATVDPAAAAGTVRFLEGDNELGTAEVAADSTTATLDIDTLTPGEHQIRAEFLPNDVAAYNPSSSTANHTVTITPALAPTTIAFDGPFNIVAGEKPNLVAKVTDADGNPVSGGQVRFIVDGVRLDPLRNVNDNGEAFYDKTFNNAGTVRVELEYIPADGSKLAPATGEGEMKVAAKTTTTLSASNAKPQVGTPVTLTANVNPSLAGGKVEFFDVTDATNPAKVGEADVNNGRATASVTPEGTTARVYEARFTPADGGEYAASKGRTTVTPQKIGSAVAVVDGQAFTAGEEGPLTARVTPADAKGTVQFLDMSRTVPAPIGGPVEVTDGVATLANAKFATDGTATVKAKFTPAADSKYSASEATGTVTVAKAAQDTTLTLSGPQAATALEDATVTATVDPAAAGTVRFYEGDTEIGSATVDNGEAKLTKRFAEGEHSIRAEFTPDNTSEFVASRSTADHTLTVAAGTVDSAVTYTGPTEGAKGEPLTLTAKVAPKEGDGNVAYGKVRFIVNGAVQGTADVDAQGEASLPDQRFTLSGPKKVVAEYVPATDSRYNPAKSGEATLVIKEASTTKLAVNNPRPTVGTPVTLTATVTPQLAQGKVEFYDVTDAANPVKLGEGGVSQGKATYRFTPQDLNERTIEARFVPQDAATGASASAEAVTVKASARTAQASLVDGQSLTAGQTGALTVRVNPNNAAGTVELFDGTTSLGKAAVNNGAATVENVTIGEADPAKEIRVVFTPDSDTYQAEETTGTVEVAAPAEETSIEIEVPSDLKTDDPATVTATIPRNIPGKVRFVVAVDGKDTEIGIVEVDGTNTTPSVTGVAAEGTYVVRAEFTPTDLNAYTPSTSATKTVTVAPKPSISKSTETTIEGPAEGKTGTPYTYTATITDAEGNPVTGGTVEFYSNDYKMGEAEAAGGKAETTYSFVIPGQRDVVAVYTPADGADLKGSKSEPIKAMMKEDAKVALNTIDGPVTAGEPLTLTATVTPQLAPGTVEFYTAGGEKLAEAPLDNGRATATITPAQGETEIQARYVPAENAVYNAGASAPVKIAAVNTASTVTVTEGQTFVAGVPGDLTARVTPVNAKGKVVFWDKHPDTGEIREREADVLNGTAVIKGIQFESPIEERTVNVRFVPEAGTGFDPSENTGTVKVKIKTPDAVDTSLTLTAEENPTADKDTTIFATVANAETGLVEIYGTDRELLGSAEVIGGRAEIPLRLAEGTHDLRGEFIPNDAAAFKPSSQTLEVTVAAKPEEQDEQEQQPPATVKPVIESADSAAAQTGKPVTLKAKVPGAENSQKVRFVLTDGRIVGTGTVIDGVAELKHTFDKPGAYALQAQLLDGRGEPTGELSEPYTLTVAAEETGGAGKGSSLSSEGEDGSSIDGPNRPWIITGIVLAVLASLAGVGSIILNLPQVRDFLAQYGIRY